MSVARVWALPGLGGMGGLRAEFAAGTETPHPSHRKKQARPADHPNSKPWGENPEAFDPDHFSPENRDKIPPNAYKPFGTGQRACIGRQYALQEATLVLGMVLQRFEFVDFANYQLDTRQTLTIKPYNFHIEVKMRSGRTVGSPAAPA